LEIEKIQLNHTASLMDVLPKPILNKTPLTFKEMNQDYGFVLYRSIINGGENGVLKLDGLRDYAIVVVNGKRVGTADRLQKQDSLQLNLPQGKVT
jgi:beta-galactosidase